MIDAIPTDFIAVPVPSMIYFSASFAHCRGIVVLNLTSVRARLVFSEINRSLFSISKNSLSGYFSSKVTVVGSLKVSCISRPY